MKNAAEHHAWRKWCVGLVLFFGVWAAAGIISHCMVSNHSGHWLELFNGATWPPQLFASDPSDPSKEIQPIHQFWFYTVLGLRTALNLGVVLSAAFWLFAFYFLSTGNLEKWFMSKLDSVLSTRDVALVAFVINRMKDQNLELSEQQEESLYQAADDFCNSRVDKSLRDSVNKAAQPKH